jgi:hypothetical protein
MDSQDVTGDNACDARPRKVEGQFDPRDPKDWYRYWTQEFRASREAGSEDWTGIDAFVETGNKVVRRYRGRGRGPKRLNDARLNLFPANVQTLRAILLGQVPKTIVTRRNEDSADDDARIAADILERVLDHGNEDEARGFPAALNKCVEDRLLPGMCGAKVRFEAEFRVVPGTPAITAPCPECQGSGSIAPPAMPLLDPAMAPPVEATPCAACSGSGQIERAPALPEREEPVNEQAPVDYWQWRDQLWSCARTFEEVRWWAFASDMSREDLRSAFGEDDGAKIPVSAGSSKNRASKDARKETPWSRARVWEIWSKEHRRLFYLAEGFPRILWRVDNPEGEDPLGLEGFWPFEPPMMANAVSDAYLPTPDYEYAKHLYDEADELTGRIRNIVAAIKVAGVRDGSNKALSRLLDEACELELIPAQNWGEYLQKGGVAGAFQLLPTQEMVNTVRELVAQRNIVIESIYQVTGLSDILRGQQTQVETATTSSIKARYASVRLQDLQRDVARYATGLQRLRKEVIAKHWSVRTIIERSGIMHSAEAQTPEGQARILRAAQLIKDRHLDFRVAIKPEQVSLQDWAQLKQQRSEVLSALGQYVGQSMPLVQMMAQSGGPEAAKAAIKLIMGNAQWLVAGMPGSSGVESAFDSFLADLERIDEQAAKQPPSPPPPDPKVQAAQMRMQGDLAKTQAKTQGRVVEIQAETRAEMVRRQHDAQMNIAEDQAKGAARMRADAITATEAVTGRVIE